MPMPTRNEELLLQAIESAHGVVQSLSVIVKDMTTKAEELRERIEKLERAMNIKKEPF